jgi:hypothetical protein
MTALSRYHCSAGVGLPDTPTLKFAAVNSPTVRSCGWLVMPAGVCSAGVALTEMLSIWHGESLAAPLSSAHIR